MALTSGEVFVGVSAAHHVDGLIGRSDVVDVIRELADRPLSEGRRHSRLVPVLVVEGTAGSGKTALLTAVASMLDQHVPYAHLDFEVGRAATTPELLSAAAFQLSDTARGTARSVSPGSPSASW